MKTYEFTLDEISLIKKAIEITLDKIDKEVDEHKSHFPALTTSLQRHRREYNILLDWIRENENL